MLMEGLGGMGLHGEENKEKKKSPPKEKLGTKKGRRRRGHITHTQSIDTAFRVGFWMTSRIRSLGSFT